MLAPLSSLETEYHQHPRALTMCHDSLKAVLRPREQARTWRITSTHSINNVSREPDSEHLSLDNRRSELPFTSEGTPVGPIVAGCFYR
ncbi:hypothetical protein NDU88_007026 [Pleurodeles waltl]|uniref:Uncharacterized protein n=1 Tax=Pleurodeles waltl TaxID=8319 RepID=A0AAV7WC98_PLEWA|nr:hypothetical protein NDU88_007026 [Pleurodeles waltl]